MCKSPVDLLAGSWSDGFVAMMARRAAFLPLVLAVFACTGGQTGDEGVKGRGTGGAMTSFEGSQCHAYEDEGGGEGVSAAALTSDKLTGLDCVSWRVEGDELHVELMNVWAECLIEIEWQGRVMEDHGTLRLIASVFPDATVESDGCQRNACIGCTYDFSFGVEKIDATAPIDITFALEVCQELHDPAVELTLPVDDEREGIRCRPPDGRDGGP